MTCDMTSNAKNLYNIEDSSLRKGDVKRQKLETGLIDLFS